MLSILLALIASPNVVVVMTDDQGYGDLGCHGHPVLKTPHLDRLHGESVRLTDFHVAPMCTPTRGQLLTGIDALENRATNVSSGRTLLRRGLPTIADHLAAAGYATGLFGKWHLGDQYPFRPGDRGFERALWFPSSHVNSVPDFWNNDYFDDVYLGSDRISGQVRQSRTPVRGYCTDVWFDHAAEWMQTQRDAGRPFFAYVATNAAHWPHFVPDAFRGPVRERLEQAIADGRLTIADDGGNHGESEDVVSFLAMIENIDANVGHLLAMLDESGLADDTLVVFLNDNGSTFGHKTYNAGMRGRKTEQWEGGHRVSCFLRHPSFETGRDVGGLTHVQDLVPTVLDVCEVQPLPMGGRSFDGISLADALRGEGDVPDRRLVIHYSRMPRQRAPASGDRPISQPVREGAAVMRGPWRLIHLDRTPGGELYHVGRDPGQTENVTADHPEVVADLTAHLDRWWEAIVADGDYLAPERVIVGAAGSETDPLTACEWLDVFVDQQRQVRRGDRKTGVWHLEAAVAGRYRIELRRFPDESGLALTDAVEQTEVTDGTLVAGPAFPIAVATIRIAQGSQESTQTTDRQQGNALVGFADLEAGPFAMQADFLDADGNAIAGAYYATMTLAD